MNENLLKSDEQISAELKKSLILATLCKIGLIVAFLSVGVVVFFDKIPFIVLSIVAFLGFGLLYKLQDGKVKYLAGTGVLYKVLTENFEEVSYEHNEHLNSLVVDNSGFRIPYEEIEGHNYMCGKYQGHPIELSGVNLYSRDHDSDGNSGRSYSFKGLWVVYDYEKAFAGQASICERRKLEKLFGKGDTKTGDDVFDKKYFVFSKEPASVPTLLTEEVRNLLDQFDEKANAGTNLAFGKDGKLYIALNYNKEAFQVKISGTDVSGLKERYTAQIRQIKELIDRLSLLPYLFKD